MKTEWIEGDDYYLNEKGLVTLTEKHHLERGYCCGSGCKHCPYGYNKKTGKVEGKKKED